MALCAEDAVLAAIEIYNKPRVCQREQTLALFSAIAMIRSAAPSRISSYSRSAQGAGRGPVCSW